MEAAESKRPDRGAVILTLGILSWFVCPIFFGIAAWVMGNNDLREMDAGRMDERGRGLTQAGRILGMIHIILAIIGLLFVFLLLGLGVLGAAAS